MKNVTTLKKFISIFLFLISYVSFSQSGVQLVWDQEVACQTYSLTDPDSVKGVFLEDIEDDICLQFCKNTPVKFRLVNTLNQEINTSWVVNGGGVHNLSTRTAKFEYILDSGGCRLINIYI